MEERRVSNDEWARFEKPIEYMEHPVNIGDAIWDICDDLAAMNFGDAKWKMEILRRFLVNPPKEVKLTSLQGKFVCKLYTPDLRFEGEKIYPDCSTYDSIWKDRNGHVVEKNGEKVER